MDKVVSSVDFYWTRRGDLNAGLGHVARVQCTQFTVEGTATLRLRDVKTLRIWRRRGGGLVPTRNLTSVTCMECNQKLNREHWPGCSGKGQLIQAGVVNVYKPVEDRKLLSIELAAWNKRGEILI